MERIISQRHVLTVEKNPAGFTLYKLGTISFQGTCLLLAKSRNALPTKYPNTMFLLFFTYLHPFNCLPSWIHHSHSGRYHLHHHWAIIDSNSRKGKEEMTAMKIAVDKFNNNSKNHKHSIISADFTGELNRAV
ncbi:hypothetical protein CK203_098319 [Vitis vinifera]|uniref:Uncharacterized protein n=1 Tax=Vitis vinifera TaxID=29760 RepID=A0A438D2K4_VITVI|nr:hypothetical protein CK203_098319 [Vitis vinifera]